MNISTLKSGKKIFVVIFTLLFSIFYVGCKDAQTQIKGVPTPELQQSGDKYNWRPSAYSGIEPGKSTRDDLIKKFGNPVWEGEEEIEGEEEDVQKAIAHHSGKRTMLEYTDINKFDGRITFFVSERDKIVQEIMLYPKQAISKESIIEKYGKDYVVLYSGETICSATELKGRNKDNKKKSPQIIVYPEFGIYVLLNGKGDADAVGFSLKCRN